MSKQGKIIAYNIIVVWKWLQGMWETKILPVVRVFVTSSLELFEFISLSILDHQVVAEIKIFRGYAIFSSSVF